MENKIKIEPKNHVAPTLYSSIKQCLVSRDIVMHIYIRTVGTSRSTGDATWVFKLPPKTFLEKLGWLDVGCCFCLRRTCETEEPLKTHTQINTNASTHACTNIYTWIYKRILYIHTKKMCYKRIFVHLEEYFLPHSTHVMECGEKQQKNEWMNERGKETKKEGKQNNNNKLGS